jgi:outer membrane protein OmpA-like peptidoglycan-associated protein
MPNRVPAFFLLVASLATSAWAQDAAAPQTTAAPRTVSSDKDWTSQSAALKDARDAEFVIRVGDVDDLGFGWPPNFDPFCGRMTEAHRFPWKPVTGDLPGFDRILLSSKFKPGAAQKCNSDGYSVAYDRVASKPVAYTIPTAVLQGATVKNAYLQLFVDDFQAPSLCSKFQIAINGARCIECEKVLNAIDQTGPVGKLLTLPLPEEFYAALTSGSALSVTIDEATGAADGFALDFIRLLVNRKTENTCTGTITGVVMDRDSGQPVPAARVSLADGSGGQVDANGRFILKGVPTGFEVVNASAPGYNDGAGAADVGEGADNPEIAIFLKKGKQAVFDAQTMSVGDAVTLNNILFDQGKADLKPESTPELDKVVAFLKANPQAEIELSGHTSSEGDAAFNRSLSYRRVKACKDYIVSKGIDRGRVIAHGYGPDRPVATNDSEANRARNRRVEMRVAKL